MSAPDRGAYAERQAQLLDALLRGDDFPPGFVAADADAAGVALRRKRGRAVAHAWPALALWLGEAFDARFDAFGRGGGASASGDPLREGLAFARSLATEGEPLGDDVRVEILLARAAAHRRGIWLRARWLREPYPRLLVVARLPLAGVVHSSIRLGNRRFGSAADADQCAGHAVPSGNLGSRGDRNNGHAILGWHEPAPIRGRVFSAWSRTWSGARRRETSGSPPGSGSPSCPGP